METKEAIQKLIRLKELAQKIIQKEDLKAVKLTWEEYYQAINTAIELLKEKELHEAGTSKELQLINISRKL